MTIQRASAWFRAASSSGGVAATGSTEVRLGHRVARSDGAEDGIWAEWRWDGRRLVVRNDRYGMFPLFCCVTDEEVVVSPSATRLLELGASRELDHDALALFIRLGFFLGEDTPFRAIRALPPGATLEWSTEGWSLSDGRPQVAMQSIGREAAIDGYIERFREAIARRPPPASGYLMPLSGGKDSRHILLELLRQGHQPREVVTARHLPPQSDTDVEHAARLSAHLGLHHRILPLPKAHLPLELRKNEVTSFCSDEHAWLVPVAEALDGATDCSYDGIGGGALSAAAFRDDRRLASLESGRLAALAEAAFAKRGRESALGSLLAGPAGRELTRERAVARFVRELETHLGASDPITSFWFWNRTRREIALSPYALQAGVPFVFAPYLDHDLFDFLTSLPPEIMADHAFHRETIETAYPQHRAVPFASKEPNPAGRAYVARVSAELAQLAARSSGTLVARRFVFGRLARCGLLGDRWVSDGHRVPMLAYLLQLERLVTHGPRELPGSQA